MLQIELLRKKSITEPTPSLGWMTGAGAIFGPIAGLIFLRPELKSSESTLGFLAMTILVGALSGFLPSLIPHALRRTKLTGRQRILLIAVIGAAAILGAGLLTRAAIRNIDVGIVKTSNPLLFLSMLAYWTSMSMLFLEHRVQRSRRLQEKARLMNLEAQIRPHFLFNTLNTVSALIPDQPVKAQAVLGQFAALFRNSMMAPAAKFVPLDGELELVRGYLEIEKARFGNRLRYSLPGREAGLGLTTPHLTLPPLTLQPLVENAVRHGVSKLIEGGEVTVKLSQTADQYELLIANPVDEPPLLEATRLLPEGHSLGVIAERLELLYKGRAQMTAEYDREFRVRLKIPKGKQCGY